jgi:hypothetical protein
LLQLGVKKDIEHFEITLAQCIGKPSKLRPFVCEGSPLDCDLFVVGYNPATDVPGDWWRFWESGYGFRESLWYPEYLASRDDGEASRTRKKIAKLVTAVPKAKALVCNIDARASRKQSDLPKPVTKPFNTFLPLCSPKVIVAHGQEARDHLAGHPRVIGCRHLSRISNDEFATTVAAVQRALS